VAYGNDVLNFLYDKTSGRCHLCRRRVAFRNYGQVGTRGCWEVDHANARARGGSNHMRNLLPACIGCNRSKQHRTTRSVRRAFGYSNAPLSNELRERRIAANTLMGLGVGALLGATLGDDRAAVAMTIAGGLFCSTIEVE
jgi:hypothetical protein